jgi:hypothetical protein
MRLDAASEGRNGMRGTVTEVSFMGESVDYQVLVDGRVVTVNQNPSVIFPLASDVRVEFDPDDALLYDDDTTPPSVAPTAAVEEAIVE